MRIKVVAGKLSLPQWVSYTRFFRYLSSRNGEPLNDDGTRLMYLRVGRDLTYGLNILVRDQKKFYELRDTPEGKAIRLAQTRNIMEFNYFYFRNANGAYVFTQYRGCATGQLRFEQLIRKRFNEFKQDENASLNEGEARRGRAKLARLASARAWHQHLEAAEDIHDLVVVIRSPSTGLFGPHGLRFEKRIYGFERGRSVRILCHKIKNAVTAMNPLKAIVHIKNKHGDDTPITVGKNIEVFDRLDFDEHVEPISFDNFHKSILMRAIEEYKDDPLLQA